MCPCDFTRTHALEKTLKKPENIALVLIKFSIPLILSGILQQLYSWADAFIVGNVEGEASLAAIGSTMSIVNFFVMAITGFTLGLSILAAQRYGAGDFEIIPKILSTFTVILGVVFTLAAVAGSIFSPQLLALMRTDAQMLSPALSYLSTVFLGVPFLAVYNVYSAVLRGVGDSRAPFFAIIVSTVVNIILDIIFVAVLHMGTFGAAVATVTAQGAMTVFTVIYAVKKHKLLRFKLSGGMMCRRSFTDGMRLGIPTMIQSCVTAFGSLVLQNFMNGFGTATVAAITTAYRVDSMILLPIINLSSGISTITAQSHGAGDSARASDGRRHDAVRVAVADAGGGDGRRISHLHFRSGKRGACHR